MDAGFVKKPHGRYKKRPDVVKTDADAGSAESFMAARLFITELRELVGNGLLTVQQARTLRGQAVNGDLEGARTGLYRIVEKWKRGEFVGD